MTRGRRLRLSLRRMSMAFACACGIAAGNTPLHAQQTSQNFSLEDLMNMSVTSAGRKEQRVMDVAAAVYVITLEDIRRSGLTTVAELLRLAPGVQVAQIDASKWAVSIRGFNKRWSDKLLVLIDGRAIYSRFNSGVFWDGVGVAVDSIERIEVIRGPGGSLWGANAVNGVINVITKSSADTQGTTARVRFGTYGDAGTGIQHGSTLGSATYRARLDWSRQPRTLMDVSTEAADGWHSLDGAARLDWEGGANRILLEGSTGVVHANSFYPQRLGLVEPAAGWPLAPHLTDMKSGHVLGRFSRSGAAGHLVELQSFVERVDRDDISAERYGWTTVDVDAKYQTPVGARNGLVAGIGYRRTHDVFEGSFSRSVLPVSANLVVFNAFVQDELRMDGDRIRITVGAKVENETYSGWGLQPTARVLFAPTTNQRVWAAVSRALRNPSRADRGLRVNISTATGPGGLPLVVSLLGNPTYEPEKLNSVEGGYRLTHERYSLDVSVFGSRHDGLQTQESQAPYVETVYGAPDLIVPLQFQNFMRANSAGAEVSARLMPHSFWHMDASYSFFTLATVLNPASRDPFAPSFDGNVPRQQWQLRPAMTLGSLELDVAALRVGAIRSMGVAGYTRIDARAAWKLSKALSLAVSGQNLLDNRHLEFGGLQNATALTLQQRRLSAQLTWTF